MGGGGLFRGGRVGELKLAQLGLQGRVGRAQSWD